MIFLVAAGLGGLYVWSLNNYKNHPSISSLNSHEIPKINGNEDLVYQAPKKVQKVEIWSSADGYTLGIPMYQNILDKIHNVWRIPISQLKYKPGRHNFKIKLGDQFETELEEPSNKLTNKIKSELERVAIVDPSGNWIKPPESKPVITYPNQASKTLRIKDDSATSIKLIGLYGDKDTKLPLSYNNTNNLWEIKNLELDKGNHKFKIIKNSRIETGPDRIITTDKKGTILRPNPFFAQIIAKDSPSENLEVESPNTTFLALKGSFDNYQQEYIFSPKDEKGNFIQNLGKLNLPEGEYEIEFINTEGLEPTHKSVININDEGKVYFPNLNSLKLVTRNGNTESAKTIKVKTPKLKSLAITFAENNWEKLYPMEFKGDHWEVTLTSLTPGRHKFKFLPNGAWENGDVKSLIVDENGTLLYPENVEPIITSLSKNTLKVKATKFIKLSIRNSTNWNKDTVGKYNTSEGVWEFKTSDLGINTQTDSRFIFKFLINDKFEAGPARVLNTRKDNKATLSKLTQTGIKDKDVSN